MDFDTVLLSWDGQIFPVLRSTGWLWCSLGWLAFPAKGKPVGTESFGGMLVLFATLPKLVAAVQRLPQAICR